MIADQPVKHKCLCVNCRDNKASDIPYEQRQHACLKCQQPATHIAKSLPLPVEWGGGLMDAWTCTAHTQNVGLGEEFYAEQN